MAVSRKRADVWRLVVDRLGAAVVSSYLFKTVASGEIGPLEAGAEGATAPETLRQTDRVTR
jgi:hypothetical protein